MLWTRVESRGRSDPVHLHLQLAADPAFSSIVLEQTVPAVARTDYTVRVFIDGLQPDRHYYYRFLAPDGATSERGRTRTAPPVTSRRPLNVAVFSCQHFYSGFAAAYRRLVNEDAMAASERKIDVALHLGDIIYEGATSGFPDLNRNSIRLAYADGRCRGFERLPSGGEPNGNGWPCAVTLDDYRFLYKAMLSDPDMRAARALYPFICTWDDHEMANDAWQGYSQDRPVQQRRLAASQAWFEYIPAMLDEALDGPGGSSAAHGFRHAELTDAPASEFDDDYLSLEPNNAAAIGALTLYRYLRWGALVDLLILDGRSYRGPRGVPEDLLTSPGIPYPAAPISPDLIRTMNEGRTANGGHPPETVIHQGVEFSNARKNAPRSSMLGRHQKEWLKRSLTGSTARWKVLCNSTPMMKFGFDTAFRSNGERSGLLWTDSWDGYPAERAELMGFISAHRLSNVVSLAGDRHAHFAGYVLEDFDDGPQSPKVIPEFAGAGVSATCRLTVQAIASSRDRALSPLVAFDGRGFGFENAVTPALNAWLLHGAAAARALSSTGSASQAQAASVNYANPHLEYADTDSYGFYIARFGDDKTEIEFVTIPEPILDLGADGPRLRRRVAYTLPAWAPGGTPELSPPSLEGEPPLLGLRRWTLPPD
jgi:alkaline phosphatase D